MSKSTMKNIQNYAAGRLMDQCWSDVQGMKGYAEKNADSPQEEVAAHLDDFNVSMSKQYRDLFKYFYMQLYSVKNTEAEQ